MDKHLWLLHKMLDGSASVREEQRLKEALEKYPVLKNRQEELRDLRNILEPGDSFSFAPGFADRVMSKLPSLSASVPAVRDFWDSLWSVFKPMTLAASAAVLILAILNLSLAPPPVESSGWAEGEFMEEALESYTYQIYGDIL